MKTKILVLLAPLAIASFSLNAQTESKPKSKEQVAHEKAQEENKSQGTVEPGKKSADAPKSESAPKTSPSSDNASPKASEKSNNASPNATEKSNNAAPQAKEKSPKPSNGPKGETSKSAKAPATPGVEAPKK